ncbi:MAG: hypothetical protein IPP49_15560 [Saprospiraceae bacterium]|nr:hypothetical protein [Saprospiraceae bacterium]
MKTLKYKGFWLILFLIEAQESAKVILTVMEEDFIITGNNLTSSNYIFKPQRETLKVKTLPFEMLEISDITVIKVKFQNIQI